MSEAKYDHMPFLHYIRVHLCKTGETEGRVPEQSPHRGSYLKRA